MRDCGVIGGAILLVFGALMALGWLLEGVRWLAWWSLQWW